MKFSSGRNTAGHTSKDRRERISLVGRASLRSSRAERTAINFLPRRSFRFPFPRHRSRVHSATRKNERRSIHVECDPALANRKGRAIVPRGIVAHVYRELKRSHGTVGTFLRPNDRRRVESLTRALWSSRPFTISLSAAVAGEVISRVRHPE